MEADGLKGKTVRDSYAHEHTLTEVLGQGGQGIVYRTQNPEIVVKFPVQDGKLVSEAENPEPFRNYTAAFRKVYLEPFPEKLHIARLVAVTQEYAGYVMRLMGDMESFKGLIPIANFPKTGGHRRRFNLLSKAAGILGRLHASGMVYCDINSENLFATKGGGDENQNVWLIDADNVFVATGNGGKLVYTPGFAAPELLAKHPCSMQSDVWSFAVLAFECLSGIHPFAGDAANGGIADEDSGEGWSQEDSSEADKDFSPDADPAFSGKLPWVEDPLDTKNHTKDGIPRECFLNDELFALFNRTFSEGKDAPELRPPMLVWSRAFARAEDTSVRCSDCAMSHVFSQKTEKCPYCGKPLPALFTLRDGDTVVFTREVGGEFYIPERVFEPFDIRTNEFPALKIAFVSRDIGGKTERLVQVARESADMEFFVSAPNSDSSNLIEEKLLGRISIPWADDGEIGAIRHGKRTLSIDVFGKFSFPKTNI